MLNYVLDYGNIVHSSNITRVVGDISKKLSTSVNVLIVEIVKVY